MTGVSSWQGQLQGLFNGQTRQDLYNLAGRDVAELVQTGFSEEHDPNGDPWQPSKAAQREGRKTLRKTGALQDGIRWKADSRGLVIQTTGSANAYAAYHQAGTRRMVSRPFFPGDELPAPYERRLTATFNQYFRERYG